MTDAEYLDCPEMLVHGHSISPKFVDSCINLTAYTTEGSLVLCALDTTEGRIVGTAATCDGADLVVAEDIAYYKAREVLRQKLQAKAHAEQEATRQRLGIVKE